MVWRPSGEVESMGWIRMNRRPDRCRRSTELQPLETRNLLSATPRIHHPHAHVRPHHVPVNHPTVAMPTASTTSTPGADGAGNIGAAQARTAFGVDGTGSTVAVIDTGVNYN